MTDRPRIRTSHPGVMYREKADGGRQYLITYKDSLGRQRFQNVQGGERDAVRARARIIDRLAHGYKIAPSKAKMEDYSRQWLETYEPPTERTKELAIWAVEKHIIRCLGRFRVSDIDVHKVAGLIQTLKVEGKKAWTIRAVLTPLRHILKRAVREGLLPTNPMDLLESHERPKSDQRKMEILDTEEIQAYLGAATDLYKPLLALLLFTGMRISEALALTWEDIDWQAGKVTVRSSKTDAGKRDIILMPSLKKLLAEYKLSRGADTTRVFWIQDRRAALRAHWRTVKRAGITKHIRIHDLRHTYASILIAQGNPDTYVAGQMGHTSSATTKRIYGHLFDREKHEEEARDRLEAQFGGVL